MLAGVLSKDFFLTCQPLSPWRCKTVDTDTCLPAASNTLQTCCFVFLVDSCQICILLIMAVTQLYYEIYTYSHLHSWSWNLLLLWNGSQWLSWLFPFNELLRLSHCSDCVWVNNKFIIEPNLTHVFFVTKKCVLYSFHHRRLRVVQILGTQDCQNDINVLYMCK